MSLPAEMLLPCSELQKQAEELVRADETPAQHKLGTIAVPEGKLVSLTPSIASAGVQRASGPGEPHTLPCPGTCSCSCCFPPFLLLQAPSTTLHPILPMV